MEFYAAVEIAFFLYDVYMWIRMEWRGMEVFQSWGDKKVGGLKLTIAISSFRLRCTPANTALPTNGPINHPTAPLPAVAIPNTRKGSRPKTPALSMFCCARMEIPAEVVRSEVQTEARRL